MLSGKTGAEDGVNKKRGEEYEFIDDLSGHLSDHSGRIHMGKVFPGNSGLHEHDSISHHRLHYAPGGLGNLSNSNVVLVLSMFVVSAGFKRTQAVKIIGRSVSTMSKGSMIKVMLGFTLASILAATFMGGAAAAFCIMAPLVTATCEELKIIPAR